MDGRDGKYISPKKTMEILGVSYSTIRRWQREGKIEYTTTNSGHKLYDVSSVLKKTENRTRKRVCYCRVSTRKQNSDLQGQIKFCQEQFPDHEIISDIGSALNWKRKGLLSILDQSINGDIEEIVVAYKDRLCRFGFELLQYIFSKYKVKLVVLNQETKTEQQEFTEDILSILTVFSNRYYGKRKYHFKVEENSFVPK